MYDLDSVSTLSTSASNLSTMSETASHIAKDSPVSAYPAPTGANVATPSVQVNMTGKVLLAVDRGAKFEVDATGAFVVKAGSPVTVITTADQSTAAVMNLGLANVPSPSFVVSQSHASENGDNKSVVEGTRDSNTFTNVHEGALESKFEQLELDNDTLRSLVRVLRTDLDTKTKETDTTADELRATKDELEVKTTDLQATKAELETFKDEFRETKERLVEDNDKLKIVNVELQKELISTQRELEEAKASLKATMAEVHAAKREFKFTKAELHETRADLSRTKVELSEARAKPRALIQHPISPNPPSLNQGASQDKGKITINFILDDGPVTVETTKTTTFHELTTRPPLDNKTAGHFRQFLNVERFWLRYNVKSFGTSKTFESCSIGEGATVHIYRRDTNNLARYTDWM